MKRVTAAVAAAALALGVSGAASAEPIKNVVLVHGAFVDGSGWKAVYDILKRDGYDVAVEDKMIPPAAQRQMAERAHARISEVASSHAVFLSHPKIVAALIERTAQGVSRKAAAN
jgi:pimeloyl-ACP methyl ester carboxylesterase